MKENPVGVRQRKQSGRQGGERERERRGGRGERR
jgi:hypothetical protein